MPLWKPCLGPRAHRPRERREACHRHFFPCIFPCIFLLDLLNAAGGTPGTFVELGALDGVTFSNTLMLEACWGWRGLLVEADPANYGLLVQSGRRASMVHSAVCAAGQGHVNITTGAGAMNGSPTSKTVQHFAHFIDTTSYTAVPCRRLDELMAEAGLPARVNFLSLDVEGAERDAIASIEQSRFQFDLALVEADGKDRQKDAEASKLLRLTGLRRGEIIWSSVVHLRPEVFRGLPRLSLNVSREAVVRNLPSCSVMLSNAKAARNAHTLRAQGRCVDRRAHATATKRTDRPPARSHKQASTRGQGAGAQASFVASSVGAELRGAPRGSLGGGSSHTPRHAGSGGPRPPASGCRAPSRASLVYAVYAVSFPQLNTSDPLPKRRTSANPVGTRCLRCLHC